MTGAQTPQLAAAYAFCRGIAQREAKNFYWAFRALPAHKSDAMCAVYAFMRKADDLADEESLSIEARRQAMQEWTANWRASRTGEPGDPLFLAVKDTQQRFGISDELLEQLVAGTTMDLQPQLEGVVKVQSAAGTPVHELHVYESFDALYRYCYLVASVVGFVTIRIFGYQGSEAEQLAERTGVAFQLTNILRDVREDAERGRIYLPLDDQQRCGVQVDDLAKAVVGGPLPASVQALLQLEIDRAQEFYQSGLALIPLIDKDARSAMRVLVTIYHRLLQRIASDPSAVFRERVSVPTPEKLAILGRGLLGSAMARLG